MILKAPKYWQKRGLISYLLLPLSLVYLLLVKLKQSLELAKQYKNSRPIICIGNASLGGSGKTPTAIAVAELLLSQKKSPIFLTRGYKRKSKDCLLIKKGCDKSSHQEAGDEALLLSEIADTIIGEDRLQALKLIEKTGSEVVIMDDGLQNLSVAKNYSILVVDAQIGFGNGLVFPSGPLRETLSSALKRTDLVLIINETDQQLRQQLARYKTKTTSGKLIAKNLTKFQNRNLLAFAGIGYPEKFFRFLQKNNLQVVTTKSFADHHNYTHAELLSLCNQAKSLDAKAITTKKDWVKFPKFFKRRIDYLDIELEFADRDLIKNELLRITK